MKLAENLFQSRLSEGHQKGIENKKEAVFKRYYKEEAVLKIRKKLF